MSDPRQLDRQLVTCPGCGATWLTAAELVREYNERVVAALNELRKVMIFAGRPVDPLTAAWQVPYCPRPGCAADLP